MVFSFLAFGCVLGGFGYCDIWLCARWVWCYSWVGVFCGFHGLSCGVSWMFLFLVGLI